MAHARLAEAWSNLDFDGNAQRELLLAIPRGEYLRPLDRMYLDAIRASVMKDYPREIDLDRQILNRLTSDQKPPGYIDLGMAYERSGDPNHALENYALAASLDRNNPASYMHIAVLQSRRHNMPEADQAFQRAEALLTLEMNPEGLAELDFERGYAANDAGNPVVAKPYLEKARKEAEEIQSVQLQIRALTQLSAAAYVSSRNEEAVNDAEEAIHLAQTNHLDVWAANGYLRLANAELHQGNLKEAEEAVHEAVQLSQQGQQPRTEAGANLTLASIMDLRGLPDQVVTPAQAALAYYQKNGFFVPAKNATLLLIRAQRAKGEYSRALESVGAFQELAVKSGMNLLMAQSEETFGTIYLDLEQYPKALEHFRNALSKTSGIDAKAYQALHCADTLWRLGRYSESDEMLKSVPATPTFQYQFARISIDSRLSRRKDREALTLARKTLADPTNRDDARETFELDQVLAESRLRMKPTALNHLNELTSVANKDPKTDWTKQLILAEADLNVGNASEAMEDAAKAADHFAATTQLSSELRSLCIAASAAKTLKNTQAYSQFLNKALDILSQLQQTWDPQALKQYLSRADLQTWMREANLPAPHDRR